MQGVQALRSNATVEAVYVYLGPASMEEWAQQQNFRQAHVTSFEGLSYIKALKLDPA